MSDIGIFPQRPAAVSAYSKNRTELGTTFMELLKGSNNAITGHERLWSIPISCYAGSAMLDADLPSWMDKADVGTVAVLTLDNGECLTAEVRDFNDEKEELIVDVVSANRPHP